MRDGTKKTPVAVLGATGAVGQRLVLLLADHPWFEIRALAASDRSTGRAYGEATRWYLDEPMPSAVRDLEVSGCDPEAMDVELAFSGLDASVAGEIEQRFVAAGVDILTNARNHRMDPDVPLVIPEINADHLALLESQRAGRGWPGAIVANPNCSTIGLALALRPLQLAFGIDRVTVATLQALSGAGYPGVASLDVTDNVIPFIGGEEEKIQMETQKILGRLEGERVAPASVAVSAMVHRVPVRDGHLLAISVATSQPASPEEAERAFAEFRGPDPVPSLPTSPARPIVVRRDPDRPQPRRDRMEGKGMSVVVGRVRPCPVLGLKFSALVHNTIRGAAGAALQNAELLVATRSFAGAPRVPGGAEVAARLTAARLSSPSSARSPG
jgi:aspartate-semialdehyde dehydrogenase